MVPEQYFVKAPAVMIGSPWHGERPDDEFA
jgi:hypothetical protein